MLRVCHKDASSTAFGVIFMIEKSLCVIYLIVILTLIIACFACLYFCQKYYRELEQERRKTIKLSDETKLLRTMWRSEVEKRNKR